MENLNPSLVLDIAIIVFLGLSILVGYIRGFTTRFVSFFCSILVLAGAYIFSKPLSLLLSFNIDLSGTVPDEVIHLLYPMVYRVSAFFILLVVFLIIKWIVLFIFRATIQRLIEGLSLTHFVDSVLGSALSLIKGLIAVFVVLCLLATPFIPNGSTIIQNSTIANHVFNLVPSISQQFYALESTFNLSKLINSSDLSLEDLDEQSIASIKTMIDSAVNLGLVTEEQISELCDEYQDSILNSHSVSVSEDEKEQIERLLETPGIPDEFKEIVRSKLIVE